MNSQGERVAEALNDYLQNVPGADVKKVAEACNTSPQAVYTWAKGELKNLKSENLFPLADITGYNARWIASGKGDKKTGNQGDMREVALVELFRASDQRGRDTIIRVAEQESHYQVETDSNTPPSKLKAS